MSDHTDQAKAWIQALDLDRFPSTTGEPNFYEALDEIMRRHLPAASGSPNFYEDFIDALQRIAIAVEDIAEREKP